MNTAEQNAPPPKPRRDPESEQSLPAWMRVSPLSKR